MGNSQLVYVLWIDGFAFLYQCIQEALEKLERQLCFFGLLVILLMDVQLLALSHVRQTALFDRR